MYFFEAGFFSLFFLVVVVMVSAGYWGHSQSKYSLYVCSTKNNMCLGVCYFRVTSLEQLSLAEFSGESAWPKVYENGLKNFPGI